MKQFLKPVIITILAVVLLYTRFVGLNWGLPYPFHPDERNMADAVVQLKCTDLQSPDCYNPHFFAYGQLPLYLAYIGIQVYHTTLTGLNNPVTFNQATIALRILSATASVISTILMLSIISLILYKNIKISYWIKKEMIWIVSLFVIFTPFFIQFSHFGTTESFLMMFYLALLYVSMALLYSCISVRSFYLLSGLLSGAALATKVSALPFLGIPFVVLAWYSWKKRQEELQFFTFIRLALVAAITAVILSPYNIIDFNDFIGSMHYESGIGLGTMKAFYTTQFEHTLPVVFQFIHIFPYTLGWPILLLFMLGFFILPLKKEFILLRFAFLLYFLPQAFLYAKWTRFMAPVFPVMLLIGIFTLLQCCKFAIEHVSKPLSKWTLYVLFFVILIAAIIPGVAYLSIYQSQDVRFTASSWIYKQLPPNAYILSETANVVDLPVLLPGMQSSPDYTNVPFNFYDVDLDPSVALELQSDITQANYIFVPSRRVFKNYTCVNVDGSISHDLYDKCSYLTKQYPILTEYYQKLFSGQLGFNKEEEFNSYPKIQLFGKTILEFPDEEAEETWTVFDHPVIRIYKRAISTRP